MLCIGVLQSSLGVVMNDVDAISYHRLVKVAVLFFQQVADSSQENDRLLFLVGQRQRHFCARFRWHHRASKWEGLGLNDNRNNKNLQHLQKRIHVSEVLFAVEQIFKKYVAQQTLCSSIGLPRQRLFGVCRQATCPRLCWRKLPLWTDEFRDTHAGLHLLSVRILRMAPNVCRRSQPFFANADSTTYSPCLQATLGPCISDLEPSTCPNRSKAAKLKHQRRPAMAQPLRSPGLSRAAKGCVSAKGGCRPPGRLTRTQGTRPLLSRVSMRHEHGWSEPSRDVGIRVNGKEPVRKPEPIERSVR